MKFKENDFSRIKTFSFFFWLFSIATIKFRREAFKKVRNKFIESYLIKLNERFVISYDEKNWEAQKRKRLKKKKTFYPTFVFSTFSFPF